MATAMCVLREQWRKRYHLLGFGIGMAGGYTTIGGPVSISAYYAVIGTVSNHAARLCEEARPRQRSPREEAFTRMSAFRILLWRAQRPHAGAKQPFATGITHASCWKCIRRFRKKPIPHRPA